jgi:hypothetical protein
MLLPPLLLAFLLLLDLRSVAAGFSLLLLLPSPLLLLHLLMLLVCCCCSDANVTMAEGFEQFHNLAVLQTEAQGTTVRCGMRALRAQQQVLHCTAHLTSSAHALGMLFSTHQGMPSRDRRDAKDGQSQAYISMPSRPQLPASTAAAS